MILIHLLNPLIFVVFLFLNSLAALVGYNPYTSAPDEEEEI